MGTLQDEGANFVVRFESGTRFRTCVTARLIMQE